MRDQGSGKSADLTVRLLMQRKYPPFDCWSPRALAILRRKVELFPKEHTMKNLLNMSRQDLRIQIMKLAIDKEMQHGKSYGDVFYPVPFVKMYIELLPTVVSTVYQISLSTMRNRVAEMYEVRDGDLVASALNFSTAIDKALDMLIYYMEGEGYTFDPEDGISKDHPSYVHTTTAWIEALKIFDSYVRRIDSRMDCDYNKVIVDMQNVEMSEADISRLKELGWETDPNCPKIQIFGRWV